jgi:hypothetical protein
MRYSPRFTIRVKSVRYRDVSVKAATEREALLQAKHAASQLALESWDAYKCAALTSDLAARSPLLNTYDHTSCLATDPEDGGRLKHYRVRVEFCRWCKLLVGAPSKRRALTRALKRSERVPIPDWFAYEVATPLGEPEPVPEEPPSQ